MAHTFTVLVHVIFSTKDRVPAITPDIAPRLYPYMGGIVRSLDCIAISINGVADHVHLLIAQHQSISLADLMRTLKTNSSKWVHETWPNVSFAWQIGYGAFSVSKSNEDAVKQYIAAQEEHHQKMTFQEEFIAFLKRHEIAYDPKYIWE
jgi:REP element-mobilizing transposase RayT